MNYERGLAKLRQLLLHDPDLVQEFQIYEYRLRENLRKEQLFGTNDQNKSDRAQVIYELNRLAAQVGTGKSFNELCMLGNSPDPQASPKPNYGSSAQPQPTNRTSASQRTQAYISFSARDKSYLNELHTTLNQFKDQGLNYWDRDKMMAGAPWRAEIATALKFTKVAIMLVSADFLAAASDPSDPIASHELPTLLAAANNHEITLLNVIVRPCAFQYSKLEPFHYVNARPLSSMSPNEREEIWQQLAVRVLDLLR